VKLFAVILLFLMSGVLTAGVFCGNRSLPLVVFPAAIVLVLAGAFCFDWWFEERR
jgi:hypothetical protein